MSRHSNPQSGWERQLQAAERQYSDFFPDLDLPEPQHDEEEEEGQDQGGDREDDASDTTPDSTPPMDTSTLFCEASFLAAI